MIPIRISIFIPITISSLIFHGTGCTFTSSVCFASSPKCVTCCLSVLPKCLLLSRLCLDCAGAVARTLATAALVQSLSLARQRRDSNSGAVARTGAVASNYCTGAVARETETSQQQWCSRSPWCSR